MLRTRRDVAQHGAVTFPIFATATGDVKGCNHNAEARVLILREWLPASQNHRDGDIAGQASNRELMLPTRTLE